MSDTLAPNPDNYIKGGATILFKRDGSAGGFTDLGNIPDFSQALNSAYVEHKTARSGILIIDRREQTEGGLQFKMSKDELNAANLALICNANAPSAFSQASGTAATAQITNPVLGDKYEMGAFRVTSVVAKRAGSITLTLGTDYTLEADAGLIRPLPGGAILTNDTVDVTFNKPAIAGNSVSPLSKAGILRGALRIVLRASDGRVWQFTHTKASVSYDGDMALSGSEFAKASGTVTVERDDTQTDLYGKWVMLPAA